MNGRPALPSRPIWQTKSSCIERDLFLYPSSLIYLLLLLPLSIYQIQMGNCQAVDAAALVIQHPSGRIERLYWPVMASEVMRTNPGHYVSLIIPLPQSEQDNREEPKTVRFTRVKLLRPNDTLALGHAYRLVTTQGMPLPFLLKGFVS